MSAPTKHPADADLAGMAWEIKAVRDALDELLPIGKSDNPVDMHSLIWLASASARAREVATHLYLVTEVRHA